MNILILGGFLGSGKTTSILQLAHYIVESSKSESKYKLVLLENEIGEVGIDDKVLKGGGYDVKNLFAGCACCSMSGEMLTTIIDIKRNINPDWTLMEATGVAYPGNIKENIEKTLHIQANICALVDAKRWKRILIPMESLLSQQLMDAKTILINKIDLVDEQTLREVEDSVRDFNKEAEIFKINALETIDNKIWDKVLEI